jgi:hypothetical protein
VTTTASLVGDTQSDPTLSYFAWSLEASPLLQPVADYLRSDEDVDAEAIAGWLGNIVRSELHPPRNLWEGPTREDVQPLLEFSGPESASPSDYMVSVGRHPHGIFDMRTQLGADERGVPYARLEEAAYRLMLLAFIGTADGDDDAMRWLGVLMARGNLNRQFTIAHFLGLITDGRIGRSSYLPAPDESAPRTDEILYWAQLAVREPITQRRSPELVAAYARQSRAQ